jgi:hypothetical protein
MKVLSTDREYNVVYSPDSKNNFLPFWQADLSCENKPEFSELTIDKRYCSKITSKYLLYTNNNSVYEINAACADAAIAQQSEIIRKAEYIGNKIPVIINDITKITNC